MATTHRIRPGGNPPANLHTRLPTHATGHNSAAVTPVPVPPHPLGAVEAVSGSPKLAPVPIPTVLLANNRIAGLRRRKKSRALRVLLIILAILLAVCVAVYAFGQWELGKIGRLGITKFTGENFEQDGSGADTIEAVDWGKADIATSVDGVVNVLLVGQDTRNPEQRARSDSMIVLSVNKNTNQLTMVSLMRDLYVKIPGYSDNKLNAAYAFGGFELLDETIATNFGIAIDYNVEINFNGFKDIIDTVDGIDVELNEAKRNI